MFVTRYRFIHPLPPRLDWSRAAYVLEVVKQWHDTIPLNEWLFLARRVLIGTVCAIAAAMTFRRRLSSAKEPARSRNC